MIDNTTKKKLMNMVELDRERIIKDRLNMIEYNINRRLTKKEFIALANMVKETYIPVKMRYMFVIKKIKEYGIQPDNFIEIPDEFKMWEIFKKGCIKSNIEYKSMFKDEIDFLDLDIRQITEGTNLSELIPNCLKSTYEQILSDKQMLEEVLRKFMTEKIRRLRLYKSNEKDKLDLPYQGPEEQEDIIAMYNEIYTNELNKPLDIVEENKHYHKLKFFFPEIWEPLKIEYDFLIAEEMINDPNFLDHIIVIWTGIGEEFHMDWDFNASPSCLSWIISCEYSWLIQREKSKENPDLEKIERLERERSCCSRKLISPILLKYYFFEQIKCKAYKRNEERKQQRKNFALKRELTV